MKPACEVHRHHQPLDGRRAAVAVGTDEREREAPVMHRKFPSVFFLGPDFAKLTLGSTPVRSTPELLPALVPLSPAHA